MDEKATAAADRSCPVCGATGAAIATHASRGERWTCFGCDGCGVAYWHPREIRPEFYADAHHDTYERRRRGESFLRERHQVFLARTTPGRLFDIGCGEGSFLAAAQARGFDVWGIDLDAGNVATAVSRGLSNVHRALLTDSAGNLAPELRGAGRFDRVTAFEVLEHQADPMGFLRATQRLLADGGRLCGSVPNRERIFAERSRRRDQGDLPPHHFLWFSASALEATLRRAGFTQVEVLPVPERDVMALAAYVEDALIGVVTRTLKRRAMARPAKPGETARRATNRRALIDLARAAKNAPFVPVAWTVRTMMPKLGRSLYFEAAR